MKGSIHQQRRAIWHPVMIIRCGMLWGAPRDIKRSRPKVLDAPGRLLDVASSLVRTNEERHTP